MGHDFHAEKVLICHKNIVNDDIVNIVNHNLHEMLYFL